MLILACIAIGCQRPPTLDPIAKVKSLRNHPTTLGLTQAVKEFSSTTNVRILAAGSVPALSPNGQHIAFVSDFSAGGSHIWVVDIDGENLKQLSMLDGSTNPQWSPDGQTIIFQSYCPKNWVNPRNWPRNWLGDNRNRQYEIWAVDVDVCHQRQLIPSQSQGDHYPMWLPNRKHIELIETF